MSELRQTVVGGLVLFLTACGIEPASLTSAPETSGGSAGFVGSSPSRGADVPDNHPLLPNSVPPTNSQPAAEGFAFLVESSCSPRELRDCDVCSPSRAFDARYLNAGGQQCDDSGAWGVCQARRSPVRLDFTDSRWRHPDGYRSGNSWIWSSPSAGAGQILGGPFETLPAGSYDIIFNGRAWTQTMSNSAFIADLYDNATGVRLGEGVWVDVVVWPSPSRGSNIDVRVHVDVPAGCHELEMRVTAVTQNAASWVGLDTITIVPS